MQHPNLQARALTMVLFGAFVLGSAAIWASAAMADLIPPEEQALIQRMQETKAFDEADQFCRGEQPEAPCALPGNAFEGGGAGVCSRQMSRSRDTIQQLVCVQVDSFEYEAGVTPPLDNERILCEVGIEELTPAQQANCPALIASKPVDRFCAGKAPGDTCDVDGMIGEVKASFASQCALTEETGTLYFRGHRSVSREELRCKAKQSFIREFSPVSFWDRLRQLLY
jgi:hypothetical protein